jgi:hypothetical protein
VLPNILGNPHTQETWASQATGEAKLKWLAMHELTPFLQVLQKCGHKGKVANTTGFPNVELPLLCTNRIKANHGTQRASHF